ncbi:MAG: S8 family peptidase [Acidobacteriota bacterium]|nr:S8 family peptidase [Acidobacteriota bacterium]
MALSGGGSQGPVRVFGSRSLCAPDEVLVKLRPEAADGAELFSRTIGAEILGRLPEIGVLRLRIPGAVGPLGVQPRILDHPDVLFAEPNYILQAADIEPSDPYFLYQWGLRNTGQAIGPPELNLPRGIAGADINAVEAWGSDTGGSILVGVIDTGVSLAHPDLAGHLESAGRDFINDDYMADDDHGHGTLIAGIIAAETDNGVGVSGLCWNGRILPVKVFDSDARGTVYSVSSGIVWAVDHGAQVLNMSLGGPDIVVNQTLASAVAYAAKKDVVMAAAAGNEGTAGVWYPAAYPDVLAVSGVDMNDVYQTLQTTGGEWGSNYGSEVDLAAPAVHILSCWPEGVATKEHISLGLYAYGEKTSMATAFGSGAAALLRSFRPDLSAAQIRATLEQTADDINKDLYPGRDNYIGYGRINLGRAVRIFDVLDPPLSLSGIKLPGVPYKPKATVLLQWAVNPKDEGRGLSKYRVYRQNSKAWTRLAELTSDVLFFTEPSVPNRETATYKVAGVNDAGVEGAAAIVIVP